MKAISARVSNGLVIGSNCVAADNSGALILRITGVKRGKVGKGRQQYARVGDYVKVSVKKGLPEMKGKVFDAIVVRQRMAYRRYTGERIAFMDTLPSDFIWKMAEGMPDTKGDMNIAGTLTIQVSESIAKKNADETQKP